MLVLPRHEGLTWLLQMAAERRVGCQGAAVGLGTVHAHMLCRSCPQHTALTMLLGAGQAAHADTSQEGPRERSASCAVHALTVLAVQPWCGCSCDKEPANRHVGRRDSTLSTPCFGPRYLPGCTPKYVTWLLERPQQHSIFLKVQTCKQLLPLPASHCRNHQSSVNNQAWCQRTQNDPNTASAQAALTGCHWCCAQHWPSKAPQVHAAHQSFHRQTSFHRCCNRRCRCHAQSLRLE